MNITGRPGRCAVAVMAKAPRPGEVKTRLVPPLSEADAAMLSGCFIRDIAGNILAAAEATPIEGYVAHSPAGSENLFAPLLPERVRLLPPHRAGLGDSLLDVAGTQTEADPRRYSEHIFRLGMREMSYGWNLEMQMRAARAGLRILELPVAHRRRAGGVSKVSGSVRGTLKANWRILLTFARVALERRRPLAAAPARRPAR